jgi:hypothetical protein
VKCCICKKEFHGFKNNPNGAAWKNKDGEVELLEDFKSDEVCCDECNRSYVIPGRLYRAKLEESVKAQKESTQQTKSMEDRG